MKKVKDSYSICFGLLKKAFKNGKDSVLIPTSLILRDLREFGKLFGKAILQVLHSDLDLRTTSFSRRGNSEQSKLCTLKP